jgi:glucokinase
MILAGDVGGTKVHLALYDFVDGKLETSREERYAAKNYSGLEEIVKEFLGAAKVTAACFGVPGPVRDGRLRLTNLPWTLDSRVLSANLGINHVFLINDLEANGYGVAELSADQRPCSSGTAAATFPTPPRAATPITLLATKTRSTCSAFSSRSTTAASARSAWSAAWA